MFQFVNSVRRLISVGWRAAVLLLPVLLAACNQKGSGTY
jgi:hypothetical protein